MEVTLTEIALVVVAALVAGLTFARFRQPPIIGYILTGIIMGPSGLAVIQSRNAVSTLAELGVLLLLFVVGMELSLRGFKKVWLTATCFTIVQIGIGIGITLGLSRFLGWSVPLALLLGFVISLSSTAVVVKMLESLGELKSDLGQLVIGILIAQDLAIVPMILILKNYHGAAFNSALFLKLFISIGFIILLISHLSRHQRVHFPLTRLIAGQKELIPLAVLTICFGAAAFSGYLGLSAPYGAFLAGLVLGNTHEWEILLKTVHPIQSILLMAFFLSIGLLFDLTFIWNHLFSILFFLLLVTVVKTGLNIGVLRVLRLPWSEAFLVGVVLSQLGEFSFLMAAVSYESKIIDAQSHLWIVSLTVLSLGFSPLWMLSARRLKTIGSGTHWHSFSDLFHTIYSWELSFLKKCFHRCKRSIYHSSPPTPVKSLPHLQSSEEKGLEEDDLS